MPVFLFAALGGALLTTLIPFHVADQIATRVGRPRCARVILRFDLATCGLTAALGIWIVAFIQTRPRLAAGSDQCPDLTGAHSTIHSLVVWLLAANAITATVAGWSAEENLRGRAVGLASTAVVVVLSTTFISVAASFCDPT
jgi:hypothetical protein